MINYLVSRGQAYLTPHLSSILFYMRLNPLSISLLNRFFNCVEGTLTNVYLRLYQLKLSQNLMEIVPCQNFTDELQCTCDKHYNTQSQSVIMCNSKNGPSNNTYYFVMVVGLSGRIKLV